MQLVADLFHADIAQKIFNMEKDLHFLVKQGRTTETAYFFIYGAPFSRHAATV